MVPAPGQIGGPGCGPRAAGVCTRTGDQKQGRKYGMLYVSIVSIIVRQRKQMWTKPYYSFDTYCKERFGGKIYKLTLNGGMTCPNRDGSLGTGGCIFCSNGGSGDFAEPLLPGRSVADQLKAAKERVRSKTAGAKDCRYIAYFQSFTNTYAPVSYLKPLFSAAMEPSEIVGLSIATRPDCLPPDVLDLLTALSRRKTVWVELGLQTMHQRTADLIRRGYALSCFEQAVSALSARGIPVVVHVILGLPGENQNDMLETARYVGCLPVHGIKLQLLHVLKNTELEKQYLQGKVHVMTEQAYIDTLLACIECLPPTLVIHRLTGDGPKQQLIAPLWSGDKKHVLNAIHHQMRIRGCFQGRTFLPRN